LSTSACSTQSGTAVSVRSKALAIWPTERSPRRHSSTISTLNCGVNERRGRGFFFPQASSPSTALLGVMSLRADDV
jgi:hypothetical protein